MFRFLAFFCFLAVVSCESSVLNAILDFMLESNREELLKLGNTSAPIANLVHDFEINSKLLNVTGNLSCMHGWVKDFSTLVRTGKVSATLGAEKFHVSADLALGKFHFGFRHCRLRLPPVAAMVSGELTASIGHHELQARASFTASRERLCSPVLESLALVGVESVSIDSTDGLFNMVISHVDSDIVQKCIQNVVEVAQAQLEEILKSAVSSLAFCPKNSPGQTTCKVNI